MKIEWRDYLAVGVDEIDAQHRELFSRFNAFLEASESGKGAAEVTTLLHFLGDYVGEHFRDEERLQLTSAFPEAQAHREAHQKFTEELSRLRDDLKERGPSPSLVSAAGRIVMGWLIDHISRMDRKVGEHLRARTPGRV